MNNDTQRKGILVDLFDWVYKEFGEDAPALVRFPAHLALCIAQRADPEERDAFKKATKADVQAAIEQSQLASAYGQAGRLKREAIHDAVRHVHPAVGVGFDPFKQELGEALYVLRNTREELRAFLKEFRGHGRLGEPFILTPPRNLPPRNDKFVGRTTELAQIHEQLTAKRALGVTQQFAIFGLGGVGKTAVALEYAWQHLDDYPGGVFTLGCDTDLLLPAIVELAPALGLDDENDKPETTARKVKTRLEDGPAGLLVLDNVRDPEQWKDAEWAEYLPGGNCRRLITTRSDHLPGVDMYAIERLPHEQGIELLARYRFDAADPANKSAAGEIVEWFDGLAVGLTVVGVYMAIHSDVTWPTFGKHLRKEGLETMRQAEGAGFVPAYEKRVDSVFDDALAALAPTQRRVLEYAALLPEDVLPRPWLTWMLENDHTVDLAEQAGYDNPAQPVVSSLVSLKLLRPTAGTEHVLALHRVLRRRVNETLEQNPSHRNGLLDHIGELAKSRGEASQDAVTDKSIRWELTPLRQLSEELDKHGRIESAVALANCIHTPLHALGRYVEARGLLSRFAEDTDRIVSVIEPAELATLLSNLAQTLQILGDLPEARRRMEQAIDIDQKHFDPDHPNLAISYSNLATILRDLGDWAEARLWMEQAIDIEQEHFDPDHPTLAISYSNLATILQDLGDLPEARRRMEQAMAIDEKHFGRDHPNLAIRYSNLAMILQDLGDLPEARLRMEQAIAIQEKHFDPDHPTLAIRYNNLAHIDLADGNTEEACRLFRRAYAIWTKHFDDDHSHVRSVVDSLHRHCGGVPAKTDEERT